MTKIIACVLACGLALAAIGCTEIEESESVELDDCEDADADACEVEPAGGSQLQIEDLVKSTTVTDDWRVQR